MPPIRCVLDTNVLISGLCFGGKPGKVLDVVIAGKARFFTSAELIDEFKAVMEHKFPNRREAIFDTLEELSQLWEVLPQAELPRIRKIAADPADDRVLECAVAAKADCIVSGDGHLLDLGSFGNIPILKPADFLKRFDL